MKALLQAFLKFLKGKREESEEASVEKYSQAGVSEAVQGQAKDETDQIVQKPAKRAEAKKQRSSASVQRKVEKIQIQVGLDFGTSTTKIAYAPISGVGRRQVRPLIFDHSLKTYEHFCLPSLAAFDRNGHLLLGIEAAKLLESEPWDSGLRRLKVVVAGRYEESFHDPNTEKAFYKYMEQHGRETKTHSPELITSIYLAYAMRQARLAIQNVPDFRNYELDLLFNVCVPIDHMQKEPVLLAFHKILAWAEAIEKAWSQSNGSFDPLEFARKVEKHVEYCPADRYGLRRQGSKWRVFAVPEAVAEAASYLTSLQRQEGIHAIIDLGAGTTDVSFFNLRIENGDLKPFWYSAGNIPEGGHEVECVIADHLRAKKSVCSSGDILEVLQVLDRSRKKSKLYSDDIKHRVRKSLEGIHDKAKDVWRAAYRHKLKGESLWRDVQVFVSGGVARIPSVKTVFSEPWMPQLKNINYPVDDLPTPEDYDSADRAAPFQRMAVAYGLSRPSPELGEFVLPADCPNHTPDSPRIRKNTGVHDGDGLIPGSNWLGR